MPSPELLWQPSPEQAERATLTRYQDWLERTRGLRFRGYDELWRWSVAELEQFWQSITDFFDVRFSEAPRGVLGRRAGQLRGARLPRQGSGCPRAPAHV